MELVALGLEKPVELQMLKLRVSGLELAPRELWALQKSLAPSA